MLAPQCTFSFGPWYILLSLERRKEVLVTANCTRLYMTGNEGCGIKLPLSLMNSTHLWEGDIYSLKHFWLAIATVQMNSEPFYQVLLRPREQLLCQTLLSLSCSYMSWWAVMGSVFVPKSRNDRRQFLVLLLLSCFSQLCSLPPTVFLDRQWLFTGTEAKFSMNRD